MNPNGESEITVLRREVKSLRIEVEMLKMRFKKRDEVIEQMMSKLNQYTEK